MCVNWLSILTVFCFIFSGVHHPPCTETSASGIVYLFCCWDHVSSIDQTTQVQFRCHDIHQIHVPVHLLVHFNGTASLLGLLCESTRVVALAVLQLSVRYFLQACVVWQSQNETATWLAFCWSGCWVQAIAQKQLNTFLCVSAYLHFSFLLLELWASLSESTMISYSCFYYTVTPLHSSSQWDWTWRRQGVCRCDPARLGQGGYTWHGRIWKSGAGMYGVCSAV